MTDERMDVVVFDREMASADCVTLVLKRTDEAPLPEFTPGAHVDLHLENGLVRQYSLTSSPSDTSAYRICVLRTPDSRGGSTAVHDDLAVGSNVAIGMPRNSFELDQLASSVILIAGGIGITPLLPMAQALHDEGRDFHVHFCVPSTTRMPLGKELLEGPFGDRVVLHTSDGSYPRFNAALDLPEPKEGVAIYVCGPQRLIDSVVQAAERSGYPKASIHQESFLPVEAQDESTFVVEAHKSGVSVLVSQNQTIAEALAAAGVRIPMSCEAGVCGTCLTGVIAGVPDHRDSFLTDEERTKGAELTVCCSRALSQKLVLDV